ncbi:MAG: hypothetical protein O3C63_09550 [Cyanobacteria bacterium]|nr:hypothetical protein [Cyanobacteriota bacterium]
MLNSLAITRELNLRKDKLYPLSFDVNQMAAPETARLAFQPVFRYMDASLRSILDGFDDLITGSLFVDDVAKITTAIHQGLYQVRSSLDSILFHPSERFDINDPASPDRALFLDSYQLYSSLLDLFDKVIRTNSVSYESLDLPDLPVLSQRVTETGGIKFHDMTYINELHRELVIESLRHYLSLEYNENDLSLDDELAADCKALRKASHAAEPYSSPTIRCLIDRQVELFNSLSIDAKRSLDKLAKGDSKEDLVHEARDLSDNNELTQYGLMQYLKDDQLYNLMVDKVLKHTKANKKLSLSRVSKFLIRFEWLKIIADQATDETSPSLKATGKSLAIGDKLTQQQRENLYTLMSYLRDLIKLFQCPCQDSLDKLNRYSYDSNIRSLINDTASVEGLAASQDTSILFKGTESQLNRFWTDNKEQFIQLGLNSDDLVYLICGGGSQEQPAVKARGGERLKLILQKMYRNLKTKNSLDFDKSSKLIFALTRMLVGRLETDGLDKIDRLARTSSVATKRVIPKKNTKSI